MRLYLIADMEGVSGIASIDLQAHPGAALYEQSRVAMTAEVAAAVEGALEGGADEVVIFDMHCHGLNLFLDELPSGTKVVVGKPGGGMLHAENLGPMDGLMLTGFHARASNPAGMLTHVYTLYIREMFLNGRSIGEVELESATAGALGIPTILVTGDSAMIEEVRPFLPGTIFADVKTPLSLTSAESLLPKDAAKCLREAATQAVKTLPRIEPVATSTPIELRITVDHERFAEGFLDAGFARDDSGLIWRGDRLIDGYISFIHAIETNASGEDNVKN